MNNKRLLAEVNGILEAVSTAVEAERSTFFVLNKESSELESLVAQGLAHVTLRLPAGKGIVGSVITGQQPVIVNHVQHHPLFDKSIDEQLAFVTRSTLCVPVWNDAGQIIGVIQCLNKVDDCFDGKDLAVLQGFAALVSLLVKNATLYHASEQIKSSFSALLEVSAAVSSELDLDALIPLIMTKAAELTQADRSSLFFMDEQQNELWTKYAKGLENVVVRTNKGIVKLVADNRQPCIVNKPYEHPAFDPAVDRQTGYTTRSLLSVPVFNSANGILGVIQVINKVDGEFTTKDLTILKRFAGQISIAIRNARLFNESQGMKNHLSALVDNLGNGIVTVDKFCRIQTANEVFYKMFDLDQDQCLQNEPIERLSRDLKSIVACNAQTIATGKKHYEYDIAFQTRKSKHVVINLSVLPMQNPGGEIIGTINVFFDVTQEKRIRSNLSRYMPQHLIKEVISNDNLSIVKGKYVKCSVLFADIRNFTTLTEELGAIQIVELLNKFFNAMVTSVHARDGIIDKFIGDAIMAVFGVPYQQRLDALNAIQCAIDMFKILNAFNCEQKDHPVLNIGIGIATGNVVSGNIGSAERFEYTVIGDPVNIAARLESATKEYKVHLLICENTYKQVASRFHCREIDTILFKGKQKPVKIYTVVQGKDQPLSADYVQIAGFYAKGLHHYRLREFSAARQQFQSAYLLNDQDGPTRLFLDRCQTALSHVR